MVNRVKGVDKSSHISADVHPSQQQRRQAHNVRKNIQHVCLC